ncbi:hypothetical protein HDA32_002319 [Spinactinospora alkalitolerans]|uniref:Oxidoreductase n=1 Tax=Spinactinospora alkalitolerans TaxID=687207 RepID=A0A852TT61_9ACTN|nr:PmoA family protein [Spinactinospora alkalitolerans]NYE47199.1 hypothetical protein [Spinactinospora alkalitolerans]
MTEPTPGARAAEETAVTLLRCRDRAVAAHNAGADLDPGLSPRPYLHPVRTFAGTPVTETLPADHVHHLGVSVAVPDVSGANFWGGRTFVRDRGPTWLPNHGRQEHRAWEHRCDSGHTELIAWVGPDGTEPITERRTVAVSAIGADAWALDVDVRLRNTGSEELSIASPAVNGRPGAGYGGFFWRAPVAAGPPRCFGPGAEGEEALHGSRSPWLALAGTSPEGAAWTLVFLAAGAVRDPWFVRAQEYPGVGAALAWDRPLVVPRGGEVRRRVVTLVADGHPGPGEVADLAAAARECAADPDGAA